MNRTSCRSWSVCLALAFLGAAPTPAAESEAPSPPIQTAAPSLSVNPAKRAPWQQRLTLGAGDTLNLSLFNMPDTAQTEVPVGPDGRITFLQARDILAAGLTIDELRAKLDESLAKFYQNPRSIVTPAVIRSKKFILLGAVVNKGVFTFDRPLTVIEAIARAGGLETGLYEQRTVELADLSRSFLARNGQRLPIDFERLFQRGDLSQNVALEPDDYLYFAPASGNEIYVLGEVSGPGMQAFAPKPTVISAITSGGGFTPRAFKSRVLVIRGSLNQPQTFVVDTAAILAGKTPDFKLQQKDIVYVSRNPWVVAAEVLDAAAKAFVVSLVAEGTTLRMPPAIK
jgi:polysaccharide biosynthesis/export protein